MTTTDDLWQRRAWLERRAAAGFAIVETCAAHVSPTGQGFPGQLGAAV